MAKNKDHGSLKVKKKTIKDQMDDSPVKVDLTKEQGEVVDTAPTKVEIKEEPKQTEDAVQEQSTNDSDAVVGKPEDSSDSKEVVEEIRDTEEEKVEEDSIPIVEIGETPEENNNIVIDETSRPAFDLPENVESLVKFMNETGGTIEDYARLNADYSKVDNNTLLREYYKKTKPHLDDEEISFIMEDKFQYNEDEDDERDIKKKKLAYKEEVASAKKFLDEVKDKYYKEIKLRPGVTQEQQKAIEFFNRYKKDQEVADKQYQDFQNQTNNLFNKDFKGFDFDLGEKKFRYGIKNAEETAKAQGNLQNFVGQFLDDKGNVKDAKGYHKALYAARNVDTLAKHFYEQGKADAVKDVIKKSKNVSNEVRQTQSGDVFTGGIKVRAISGSDLSKLKIRTRK
tara:strand:- start:188 stop:1375 length:1188 start_codon:yes stop_codon:yes gene_type:complete